MTSCLATNQYGVDAGADKLAVTTKTVTDRCNQTYTEDTSTRDCKNDWILLRIYLYQQIKAIKGPSTYSTNRVFRKMFSGRARNGCGTQTLEMVLVTDKTKWISQRCCRRTSLPHSVTAYGTHLHVHSEIAPFGRTKPAYSSAFRNLCMRGRIMQGGMLAESRCGK
jgi:hypothetical protein